MAHPRPWQSVTKDAFVLCSHIYDANDVMVLMDVRTDLAKFIVACVNASGNRDPAAGKSLIEWVDKNPTLPVSEDAAEGWYAIVDKLRPQTGGGE